MKQKPKSEYQANLWMKLASFCLLLLAICVSFSLFNTANIAFANGSWMKIMAWGFTLLFLFFLIPLLLSLTIKYLFHKILFYEHDIIITTPKWIGPLGFLPTTKLYLSYDEIRSVERRREIYTIFSLPLLSGVATSITSADQERHVISYRPFLKFHAQKEKDAGYMLARKAGRPLANHGSIPPMKLLDVPKKGTLNWKTPSLAPQLLSSLNKKVTAWRFLLVLLCLLFIYSLIYLFMMS